ncbi:MAG: MFS transporter [Phycisphaerae bacterium]|nr:MFS transporter [Phycisphaerae bacterium]
MWRGVSLRKLGLLILGPFLVESIGTLLLTWMILQASQAMDRPPRQLMLISAVGAAGYCVSAFLAGRWVRPTFAPALMIGSVILTTLCGSIGVWADRFDVFLITALLMGICIGHYYVPFQLNISRVRPFHTLAWSVAFYNLAWGSGAALGPYLSAALHELAAHVLLLLAWSLAALHTLLNLVALTAPPTTATVAPRAAFASTPGHRRRAVWSFLAVGLAIRGLFGVLWPDLGKTSGWSDQQIGLGLLCMYLPVPAAALVWARLRRHLQEPWIMIGSMILGGVGMGLLPLCTDFKLALACVLAVGLMESCVVFCAVYYANSDPVSPSRSVGLVEAVAGLAFVLGPVTLGLAAWDDARSARPYLLACGLLGAMIVFVLVDRLRPAADQPR